MNSIDDCNKSKHDNLSNYIFNTQFIHISERLHDTFNKYRMAMGAIEIESRFKPIPINKNIPSCIYQECQNDKLAGKIHDISDKRYTKIFG